MKSLRSQRTASLLQTTISAFIQQELQDIKTTGLISITKVELSKNLKSAKIHVSIFGGERHNTQTLNILTAMKWQIKRHIGQTLAMQYIPELFFTLDKSLSDIQKIQDALRSK